MKIESIEIENLNSLYGKWRIDLTSPDFSGSPIFAITGATGAGKTTILDAITLALYGATPRLDAITLNSNEVMSKGAWRCSAKVAFRQGGKRYFAIWAQTRANKSPEGRLQKIFQELSDENGTVLASNKTQVQKQLEEICGLDFDRFLHAMLLAQGRFAEFLKASDSERAPILERVTGTKIYSDISIAVFQKAKKYTEDFEQLSSLISNAEVFTAEERIEKLEEIKILAQTEKDISNQKKAYSDILARLVELDFLKKKLADCEKNIAQLETKKPVLESIQNKLELANKATSLETDYALVKILSAELSEVSQRESALKISAEVTSLALKEKNDAKLVAEKLLDSAKLEYATRKENINAAREFESIADKEREIVKLARDSLSREQKNCASKEQSLKDSQKKYDDILEQKSKIYSAIKNFPIEQILEKFRALLDETVRKKTLIESAKTYDETRAELADGDPCPLCGSLHHPFASNPPDSSQHKDELDKLSQELNRAQTLSGNHKFNSENKRIFANISLEEISADRILLAKQSSQFEEMRAKSLALDLKEASLKAELSAISLGLEEVKKSLLQAKENLTNAEKKLSTTLQKRFSLCGEKNLKLAEDEAEKLKKSAEEKLEKAKSEETEIKLEVAKFSTELKSLSTHKMEKEEKLLGAKQVLMNKIALAGFENLDDFLNARMEQDAIEKMSEQVQQMRENLAIALSQKKETLSLIEEKEFVCDSSSEELKEKIESLENALLENVQKRTLAESSILNDDKAKESLAQTLEKLENTKLLKRKWDKLNALIGSADGKNFRTFAQGVTFDIILNRANSRLVKMSDRYLLQRAEHGKFELCVFDNYQGGQLRPISNLSGGETFILSLALALGFSDMAAGNFSVESLFLDEGFGSLDEKSLNVALDALASLNADGRQIGIISHVDALKERIAAQINVEVNAPAKSVLKGAGCSKLV